MRLYLARQFIVFYYCLIIVVMAKMAIMHPKA